MLDAERRFMDKCVDVLPSGCRIWMGAVNEMGYGTATIGQRRWKAHRAAWYFEKGGIPQGMHVLHKCDVPSCVNPDHLFLGTQGDNMRDMASKGRQRGGARGERQGSAKLSAADVRMIRRMAESATQREIAEIFGIDRSNVSLIITRKAWAHVN